MLPSDNLTLYFDGACEPSNPGGVATYGWLIQDGEQTIAEGKGVAYDGGPLATNNVAEYCGLGHALRWLIDNNLHVKKLDIFGDSKLVICQMQKTWQCKAEKLVPLRRRCLEYVFKVAEIVTYTWIPREKNWAADTLTRVAYSLHTKKPFPERHRYGQSGSHRS